MINKGYINITSDAADHLLIDRHDSSGFKKSLLITNKATSGNPCYIKLFLYKPVAPNKTFVLLNTFIPPLVSLLVDNERILSYDTRNYQLKLESSVNGGTSSIDIIIK